MDFSTVTTIKDNFIRELNEASSGKKTSLPYIIHEMPEFSLVKDKETFQVIVIGGTFAINAHVTKKGTNCEIISQETSILPTLANREDFLIFVEQLIDDRSRVIALNFAYPIIPLFHKGKLDGKLLRGTKGHTLRGLVGKPVGEEVEKYISGKKQRKLVVSAANDTVCLLLSGLEKTPWEKLGAGIVGSGMNFAFYTSKNTLVNLESADFDKFESSKTGKEIDKESANRGKSHYEKEVAGIYLYKHFNKMLRTEKNPYASLHSTEELDTIAKTDNTKVGDTARFLLERSAVLIAAQVAAIMEFRNTDMTFVMEGSLFWKGHEYKKTVEEYVEKLTTYKASFVGVKNSGIVGAAHLVA